MRRIASDVVATEILDPQAGNVTFKIRDEDEDVVCLSAQKKILAANSEYFKARKQVLEPSLTLTGFAAEWDQFGCDFKDDQQNPDIRQQKGKRRGPRTLSQIEKVDEVLTGERSESMAVDSNEQSESMAVDSEASREIQVPAVEPDSAPERRREERAIISVDNVDSTTMHNILYYLYTGCVNLHFSDDKDCPVGYPAAADPFLLYRAANMYMLEELENRCYLYLCSTCTPENLIERLFDNPECVHHDRIRNMYVEYLTKNFESIKTTKEWNEMWVNMKDCSEELVAHKSKLLLEITSKMTFGVE